MFATSPILAKDLSSKELQISDTLNSKSTSLSPIHFEENSITQILQNESKPITPPKLKIGSKVALTSPSSTTNSWELAKTIKLLKNMGLEVILGKTITEQKNKYRYLSADDETRAKEFNLFASDPSIDAVIASRGGYGAMRMIDSIDYDAIKNNPKIFVGFSDFTFILLAISKMCNLETYHGPVGTSSFSEFTTKYFKSVLFENEKKELVIKYNFKTINPGIAEGKLIGGNLTLLTSSLGTKYEFDSNNSILFIEEVSEHAYEFDRMLNQLKLAGKFDNVNAIILGQFKNLNTRRSFFPNKGYTIMEVIDQIIKPLKVPTILDFPIGHVREQVTLPILSQATLNTTESKLIVKIN